MQTVENLETKEAFKVTDLSSATWAMRKLSEIEKKAADIKAVAESEKNRIEEWEAKQLQKFTASQDYFKNIVSEFLIEQKQEDPKFKISTPYGNVSTRKKPDSWEYDEETIVNFLKKNEMSDYIKVEESIDKTSFKKAVNVTSEGAVINEDGVLVEGVKVVPQGESVVFKIE